MQVVNRGFHSWQLGANSGLNSRSYSGPTQAKLKEELGTSTVNAQNDFIPELLFVHVFTAILSGVGGRVGPKLRSESNLELDSTKLDQFII